MRSVERVPSSAVACSSGPMAWAGPSQRALPFLGPGQDKLFLRLGTEVYIWARFLDTLSRPRDQYLSSKACFKAF